MARPVIALLTDFGLRDHYVGTMKGVALGICPEAALVDITHDVPAHDVLSGALELDAAYRYFPAGTIFLAVVDPGVGSVRRAIAMEAGDYRFVGPDNGLFTRILEQHPPRAVVQLTDARFARSVISKTFEGRDRFAPAAAWLAAGRAVEDLGQPAGALTRLDIPRVQSVPSGAVGAVLRVDRFGNLITNIDQGVLDRCGEHVAIEVAGRTLSRPVATYADVAAGAICALLGSSGHLEIAVNGGSAAEALGAARGTAVYLRRTGDA
jgi:S-adenosylmethionine hydrolase